MFMRKGIFVIASAAVGFIAVPLISALPEPISTLTLLATTAIYPFFMVWVLQEEARRNQ